MTKKIIIAIALIYIYWKFFKSDTEDKPERSNNISGDRLISDFKTTGQINQDFLNSLILQPSGMEGYEIEGYRVRNAMTDFYEIEP